MKSILRPFLVLFAALAAPAVMALDIAATDIAGLRAGMTVDEAEAALRRHAEDFTITRHEITYGYSDGATHEAVQTWIDGLEEEAVRKREASAELPSL